VFFFFIFIHIFFFFNLCIDRVYYNVVCTTAAAAAAPTYMQNGHGPTGLYRHDNGEGGVATPSLYPARTRLSLSEDPQTN